MLLLMAIRRDILVIRLTIMVLIIGHTATTVIGLITIPITDAGLDTVVGAVGITGVAGVMEAVVVIGEVVIVAGVAGKSGSFGS